MKYLRIWLLSKTLDKDIKCTLSALRQYRTTENPFKMMKNAFVSPKKLISAQDI